MSLERKDCRFKLDPAIHPLLAVVAESENMDQGDWVERLVTAELQRRVHAATVLAEAAARLGIAGNGREKPGLPGNGRESRR